MELCCEEMQEAVTNGVIEMVAGEFYITSSYQVSDGGGHYDTMEDSKIIKFCPFCGKELR
jgi:hypothetical protein